MLQALALTNSDTRYGVGSIFACFVNEQINGVKVKIIMSFEVKIVSTAMIKLSIKKILVWLDFDLFSVKPAM